MAEPLVDDCRKASTSLCVRVKFCKKQTCVDRITVLDTTLPHGEYKIVRDHASSFLAAPRSSMRCISFCKNESKFLFLCLRARWTTSRHVRLVSSLLDYQLYSSPRPPLRLLLYAIKLLSCVSANSLEKTSPGLGV